jgi:hypothetical protein
MNEFEGKLNILGNSLNLMLTVIIGMIFPGRSAD